MTSNAVLLNFRSFQVPQYLIDIVIDCVPFTSQTVLIGKQSGEICRSRANLVYCGKSGYPIVMKTAFVATLAVYNIAVTSDAV